MEKQLEYNRGLIPLLKIYYLIWGLEELYKILTEYIRIVYNIQSILKMRILRENMSFPKL
jgi:hypothetical protein